MTLLARQISAE